MRVPSRSNRNEVWQGLSVSGSMCRGIVPSRRHKTRSAAIRGTMDDAQLVAATAHGDAEAFAAFYRRHLPRVVGLALRATGDPELTADLAGEVFAVALASASRYEPIHDT